VRILIVNFRSRLQGIVVVVDNAEEAVLEGRYVLVGVVVEVACVEGETVGPEVGRVNGDSVGVLVGPAVGDLVGVLVGD